MSDAASTPVFINCRDRLTPLLALLDYVERAGCERIYLLDNDSAYQPLLDFYESTSHEVIRFGENVGHRGLWQREVLREVGVDGPFVLTDPDIVPVEECPMDAIEYFAEVLDRYPRYVKAGFGLKIDDLPDHYRFRQEVMTWEPQFWATSVAPRLYEAPIDTTFALYRDGAAYATEPAVRTGRPYLARHTSWYSNTANRSDEERFYLERIRSGTARWSTGAFTQTFRRQLERTLAGGPTGGPLRSPASAGSEGDDLERAPRSEAARVLRPWSRERTTLDETDFSPDAEPGWRSWTEISPELEYCEFAVALMRMTRPATIVETGTGQGFVTRRIGRLLGPDQRLTCFESDPVWREALASLSFFDGSVRVLSAEATPSDEDLAHASLVLLDSGFPLRFEELEKWWQLSHSGSLVLVHDAAAGHPPEAPPARMRALIRDLGIHGVFLENPRGGFLGLKT